MECSIIYGPKVEGAKANTPSKTNTYKCLPITNILLPKTVSYTNYVAMPAK